MWGNQNNDSVVGAENEIDKKKNIAFEAGYDRIDNEGTIRHEKRRNIFNAKKYLTLKYEVTEWNAPCAHWI